MLKRQECCEKLMQKRFFIRGSQMFFEENEAIEKKIRQNNS